MIDQLYLNRQSQIEHHDGLGKAYVVGFLFNENGAVALIRKVKPVWQAGKLNGIGGKVERDETPLRAMVREFAEETGVVVAYWRCFAILHHAGAIIYAYTATCDTCALRTMTDEVVMWLPVTRLSSYARMANLDWLVPMARSQSDEVAIINDATVPA